MALADRVDADLNPRLLRRFKARWRLGFETQCRKEIAPSPFNCRLRHASMIPPLISSSGMNR